MPGCFMVRNEEVQLALPCSDSEDSLNCTDEEDNEELTSVLLVMGGVDSSL